jgi:hypothetical protein
MCTEVRFARRDSAGKILRVGGTTAFDAGWALTVPQAIKLIQSGEWHFFTRVGKRAEVKVGPNGTFLTTSPDGIKLNNLDELPDSSKLDELREPGMPGSFPPARTPKVLAVRRPGSSKDVRPADRLPNTYPVLPGNVRVIIDAPWPGSFEIAYASTSRPGATFSTLVDGGAGRTTWPQNDAVGWWTVTSVEPLTRMSARWTLTIVLPRRARLGTRRSQLKIVHRSSNPDCKEGSSEPLAIGLMQGTPRPSLIHHYTAAQQKELADAIFEAITPARHEQHAKLNHNSTALLSDHRDFIASVEEALIDRGLRRYVPLPAWGAHNAIPAPFHRVKPHHGSPSTLSNTNPQIQLPSGLRPPAIYGYQNDSEFLNAIRSYHSDVHIKVGGAMEKLEYSASATIFYPWHAYIDSLWWTWQVGPR